jgi:hypothetical protein
MRRKVGLDEQPVNPAGARRLQRFIGFDAYSSDDEKLGTVTERYRVRGGLQASGSADLRQRAEGLRHGAPR